MPLKLKSDFDKYAWSNNFISNIELEPIISSRYFCLSILPRKSQIDFDDDFFIEWRLIK